MLFPNISLFHSYNVKPLDFTSASRALNTANDAVRLKKTSQLLARRKTLSNNYLPGNPFGGMNMFGRYVEPEPSLTIPEAAAEVENLIPVPNIIFKTHEAKINGRKYSLYLFEFNGKKYWHPFGNTVSYQNGKSDCARLYKYAEENFVDRSLPEGFDIELDHPIPETFAIAMNIPRNKRVSVLVPKFANAVRTNNQELVEEFLNFDWRLSKNETILGKQNSLSRLIRSRLQDSQYRNLVLFSKNTQYVRDLKKQNPNINLDIYKAIYIYTHMEWV